MSLLQVNITFQNNTHGFSCFYFNKKTRARGIHKLLKEILYPNTDILKQTLYSQRRKKKKKRKHKGNALVSAQQRGCQIDRDIMVWSKEGDRADMKEMHPFSRKLITAFYEWKWTPVEAQGYVGMEQCRVATAFDLLVRNADKQLVLLEIKSDTGCLFESTDEKHIPRFEHPGLSGFYNNGLNRALIQVALTARYFHATRPSHQKIHQTYVVRVDDDRVKRYEQDMSLITSAMPIVEEELVKRIR